MCCNYCLHFSDCKKAKKTNEKCCNKCAEYEFCPLINTVKNTDNFEITDPLAEDIAEGDTDLGMLDDEL